MEGEGKEEREICERKAREGRAGRDLEGKGRDGRVKKKNVEGRLGRAREEEGEGAPLQRRNINYASQIINIVDWPHPLALCGSSPSGQLID